MTKTTGIFCATLMGAGLIGLTLAVSEAPAQGEKGTMMGGQGMGQGMGPGMHGAMSAEQQELMQEMMQQMQACMTDRATAQQGPADHEQMRDQMMAHMGQCVGQMQQGQGAGPPKNGN